MAPAVQALVSPTDKNLRDALQGGVDAAELASVLPLDMYTADGRYGTLVLLTQLPEKKHMAGDVNDRSGVRNCRSYPT